MAELRFVQARMETPLPTTDTVPPATNTAPLATNELPGETDDDDDEHHTPLDKKFMSANTPLKKKGRERSPVWKDVKRLVGGHPKLEEGQFMWEKYKHLSLSDFKAELSSVITPEDNDDEDEDESADEAAGDE